MIFSTRKNTPRPARHDNPTACCATASHADSHMESACECACAGAAANADGSWWINASPSMAPTAKPLRNLTTVGDGRAP